nr:NACHT domain- and WD repeat-containing protein 1-like [Parasteatoda tepidariorum]
MADSQDSILDSVLHGNVTSVPEPPSRVVKIMVISSKSDFEMERRYLHENVWPELQRHCAASAVDFEILDVQQGNDLDSTYDPYTFELQLKEIENSYRESLGCFLLCLIGNKYKPCPLPRCIEATEFNPIYDKAHEAGLDVSLLNQWYTLNSNMVPPTYVVKSLNQKLKCSFRRSSETIRAEFEIQAQELVEEEEQVFKILQYGARQAYQEGLMNQNKEAHQRKYFMSGVYNQLDFALGLSTNAQQRMICVIRQIDGLVTNDSAISQYVDVSSHENFTIDEESASGVQNLIDDVIFYVNRKNIHYFNVQWKEGGLDTSYREHKYYLEKFGNSIFTSIKTLVDEDIAATTPDWQNLPPRIRKPIQEVVRESQSHLSNSRQHLRVLGVSQSLDSDCGALLQIQNLMIIQDENRMRHSPVIVYGQDGSGKSTLLSQVFMYCPEWLGNDVVRIIRHVGRSPCTSFTPELLRNLCLHISLLFGFEISPSHYSFELGKLSIWFQDLIKLVEAKSDDLVIVLDNLHSLRCAPNNQASILGWLPWNLPPNVHIICSIAEEEEKILGLLKSRISTNENFVHILPVTGQSALSMMQSNLKDNKYSLTPEQWQLVKEQIGDKSLSSLCVKLLSNVAKNWTSSKSIAEKDVPLTLKELVNLFFIDLENKYGVEMIRKISTYLTCTSFGLREAEIVELLASTEYEGPQMDNEQDSKKCEFTTSSWLDIKKELSVLMKMYYVDKRPYLYWSHTTIADAVRERYLPTSEDSRVCHTDLGNAFHLGFLMEKEQKGSPMDESKSKRRDDWSDMLREIDELWYHLMLSGDQKKLKQDAVCNFDFLLAATRGASISYTRSILEIVRCQMLDWEIELLYSMTKQSVDVLSQDPLQLATEILNWLKPLLNGTTKTMDMLVSSAREWCNNNIVPVLVPQNSWLNLTLPPQVTMMTCLHPLNNMVSTPDSQHALCVSQETNIEMYHLPSRNLVRVFSEHKERITCLYLTLSGRFLISGSKDSEIIVWDVEKGSFIHKLNHHSSGVQCLTTTHSEELIISGSDSGVVIISRLDSSQVVHKLENHRGVISTVAVNSGDDIFASASTDRCVCIWSLEDFSLLNTIHLTAPITHMDISWDSTFLLLACTDQSVHVRSLTTGSDVHCLYGHAAAVTSLCFARDNCRCVVGCKDGKVHLFDIHSAKLLQTLSGHSDPVTSIQAQDNDRFLITCGGNKIVVWNFFCKRTEMFSTKSRSRKEEKHQEPVTCIAVSRDGSLAVSGSKDRIVKVWQLNSGDLHASLKGHTGTITCVAFSPNGLFAVSGSEDATLKVWGLTLSLIVSTFQEHQSKIIAVAVTSDSRRILSVDSQNHHRLWQADNGTQLILCSKSSQNISVHANIVFAMSTKNDNCVRYWSVLDMESERMITVGNTEVINFFSVSYDCQSIVTGSHDKSLKVFEVGTGKLTQVLVGHQDAVTCATFAPLNPSLVVSGSVDCNLIVWDVTLGEVNFTLRGHTETVTGVKLTLDGSLAISASDDNTLGIWNTSTGLRVGLLGIHQSIVNVAASLNLSQVVLQVANQHVVPLLKLHNNPSKGMILDLPPGTPVTEEAKTPGHSWRGVVPQRVLLRGNLKREQSFDSFYWDLRSSSPKHDLGLSLEDFRRVPSPFGSREHLHLAGTVWDGRVGGRGFAHASDLQPKAKLPKHKMLKKQQSMFACFPEFMTQQISPQQLISPQGLIKELDQQRKVADFGRMTPKLTAQKSLSRAASLEETGANSNGNPDGDNVSMVKQSSVCTIS